MSNTTRKGKGTARSSRRMQGGLLRIKRRNKSTAGAVVLSGLTVVFIFLSYRTGNALFQFDSIVSFLSALVLLFRDASHTVQARVVNRILASSHQLVADLSAYGFGGSGFLYVPEGRKVADVMLVPVKEAEMAEPQWPRGEGGAAIPLSGGPGSQPSRNGASGPGTTDSTSGTLGDLKEVQKGTEGSSSGETNGRKVTAAISNLKFPPPGRAMAELLLRDSGLNDPTLDQIIVAIPEAIVNGFQLADSSSVGVGAPGDETVVVTLVHPVLTDSCGLHGLDSAGIVGCEVCSMLAVLFASSTGRLVSLSGCIHDETSDTSTASLHFGAKYQAD